MPFKTLRIDKKTHTCMISKISRKYERDWYEYPAEITIFFFSKQSPENNMICLFVSQKH